MRFKILLIFSTLFFFITAKSQDPEVFVPIFLPPGEVVCSDEEWKLVFYDEFNGSCLDLTKWRTTYPYGAPADRLHGYDEDSQEFLEAQVYLDENVVIQNGCLKIIAKKENVLYEGYNKPYSSGMIHTREPFDFLYGKFEIRAKIPYGMGFWPAFWLYGSQGNEIDIFEFGCHAPDKLFTNAHTEETGVHADWSIEHDYNVNFSDDFHIYTLEWGVNVIYFKVDGSIIRKMYRTYTIQGEPLECSDNFAWGTYMSNTLMPDNELDIIINLAITSELFHPFTDPPNSSTIFPNQFQIDYVRVYQRTAPAPPTGLTFSNITYIDATLSWSPSAGATGYNIYEVVGQSHNQVNSSPITGTSFNIVDLEPNTTHQYYVRALSNVGLSDPSNTIPVTTRKLPIIIGSDNICPYTNSTYRLSELLSGATVNWIGLSIVSGQGTASVICQATRNGPARLCAVITLSTGQTINLKKDIFVGTREPAILLCPASEYPYFNTHLQFGYVNEDYYLYAYRTNLSNNDADYRWRFYSSDPFELPVLGQGRQIEFSKSTPGDYTVSLHYNGVCGWSNETFETIRFEYNVRFGLLMFPNPATEETTLSIESEGAMTFDEDEFWDVEVYSSSMILKMKKNKIKGKEVKIKTNGWKTGIYFVRVKYKDLILENKLIIK